MIFDAYRASRRPTRHLAQALLFALMFAVAARAEVETDIVFCEAGGEKLMLDAYVPSGNGPFPACILVHGGGWVQGDKYNNFRTILGPLGEAGFAWLREKL